MIYNQHSLDSFRSRFIDWCDHEITPYYLDWEKNGVIPKSLWQLAGSSSFLCLRQPKEFGGQELDFRYSRIIIEELAKLGISSIPFALHSDVVSSYIDEYGTYDQKLRWLPKLANGATIGAIAMTEQQTGSDLQSIQTTAKLIRGEWVLNGKKTYISNGINNDLCIVLCRTGEQGIGAFSLFVVESHTLGFSRNSAHSKIGLKALDVADLNFDNCRIPKENLLGSLGGGLLAIMAKVSIERLIIAIHSSTLANHIVNKTVDHLNSRRTFGTMLSENQAVRFSVAEMKTETDVTNAYIDACVTKLIECKHIPIEASKAKYWATEMLGRIADRSLQLFGASGYMSDSFVGRCYTDARAQRIFGGANDILLEVIGKHECNIRLTSNTKEKATHA